MLVISRNDIRRRMLPTPDFIVIESSLNILCVLGLDLVRMVGTTPAASDRSDRKESRSDANFRSAFSKSTSFNPPDPLACIPLIVVLLLLLSVPDLSDTSLID